MADRNTVIVTGASKAIAATIAQVFPGRLYNVAAASRGRVLHAYGSAHSGRW